MILNGPSVEPRGLSSTCWISVFCAEFISPYVSGLKRSPRRCTSGALASCATAKPMAMSPARLMPISCLCMAPPLLVTILTPNPAERGDLAGVFAAALTQTHSREIGPGALRLIAHVKREVVQGLLKLLRFLVGQRQIQMRVRHVRG